MSAQHKPDIANKTFGSICERMTAFRIPLDEVAREILATELLSGVSALEQDRDRLAALNAELVEAANAVAEGWYACGRWPDTTSDRLGIDDAIKRLEAVAKVQEGLV